MKIKIVQFALAVAVLAVVFSPSGYAGPVSIDIEMGTQSGFSNSWIHSATSCGSDGFCKGGALLFALSGTISGTLDVQVGGERTLTLTNQTITATPQAAVAGGGTWSLTITSGTLQSVPGGGDLDGVWTFNYNLDRTDGPDTDGLENIGTFYFFPVDFGVGDPEGPNYLDDDAFTLWGNNWNKDLASGAGSKAATSPHLGIDLRGGIQPSITSLPEPDSLLLTGTALLFGVGLLKRKVSKSV